MAIEVIMPQAGLTMTHGEIIQWLKEPGSIVKKDEPIAEVQSDKFAFEIEAPADGTLLKVFYAPGEAVPVTKVIAYIGAEGEEVSFPESDNIQEEPKSIAAEAGTAGASSSVAENSGEKQRLFISPRAKKRAMENGLTAEDLQKVNPSGPNGRIIENNILNYIAAAKIKATPLAVKIAAEQGVDLKAVTGTDLGGKITQNDVLLALDTQKPSQADQEAPFGNSVLKAIPVEGIRKIIAERMHYSVQTAPHVTLTTEVDVTEMLSLREQLNNKALNGEKLSVTDIILKISTIALQKHPELNATFAENYITLFKSVNIGIAVAIENGLVVPNIKEANNKSLGQISREARELIKKAREGKLKPDEMSGGTFTVTNLGTYEIDAFTPIINQPESAILGVGRSVQKPAVVDGEIKVRSMMVLSLSFDHRVVDGAPAAAFLRTIKYLLENPLQLLLGV